VTIFMTLTSAGFKYVNLPSIALQEFSGADFQTISRQLTPTLGSTPSWVAIDVSCRSAELQLQVIGSGASHPATLYSSMTNS
jgi:hypothetical protein